MTETTPNKQGEKPSARRARELIEKMSEQGEEAKDAPELQPAKDFLNSVWQGNAISRTPSGSRRFKQSDRTSRTQPTGSGGGPGRIRFKSMTSGCQQ